MADFTVQGYVVNYLEKLVDKEVARILQNEEICACSSCFGDIVALTLNEMGARYVGVNQASKLGDYSRVRDEDYYPLVKAIYAAMKRVSEKPRHPQQQIISRDVTQREYQIHNHTESIVKSVVQETLQQRDDICTCDQCMTGVLCDSLNQLKPRYVSTTKGQIYAKTDELDFQYGTQLLVTVFNAFDKANKQNHAS